MAQTARISGRGWFAIGAASGVVATVAVVVLWSVMPVACSAVGYMDSRPIRLALPAGTPADAQVSACFDLDCVPSPVEPDASGEFSVPQEEPYLTLGSSLAGVDTTGVYVEVRVGEAVVTSNRFGIGAVSEAPFWSRCPGPFHYDVVRVGG